MEKKIKKIIIGIGIPGSGKTTVLKSFSEKYGYEYINTDEIREELTGDAEDQSKNKEVWDLAYRRAISAIHKGIVVVFDATFTEKEKRLEFIEFARANGVDKIQAVYVDTPLETAQERNLERAQKIGRLVPQEVIEKKFKSLSDNPPETIEGIDSVFTLDENGELTSLGTRNKNTEGDEEIKSKHWVK